MKWQKLTSRSEKVGYKSVTYKSFKMPDGTTQEYTTWNNEGRHNVAVIALTKKNEIIVAKQFRAGPEEIMYELPGGGVDKDEDIEKAAHRELREETGYETKNKLIYLGKAYRDAYMNDTGNYFIALDCVPSSSQSLDESEYVEIELLSIEELIRNAKNARMTDGIGVFMAYDFLQGLLQDA